MSHTELIDHKHSIMYLFVIKLVHGNIIKHSKQFSIQGIFLKRESILKKGTFGTPHVVVIARTRRLS